MNSDKRTLEERYSSYREEYNPARIGKKIKILFVAESPPKPRSGKLPYFYNKYSQFKGLWWHFNKALYEEKTGNKEEFLQRFMDDGYYLIDLFSTRNELNQLRKRANYEQVLKITQRLFKNIERLKPEKVILLGKRSVKMIAACLPFGSKTNKERFHNFVSTAIRKP